MSFLQNCQPCSPAPLRDCKDSTSDMSFSGVLQWPVYHLEDRSAWSHDIQLLVPVLGNQVWKSQQQVFLKYLELMQLLCNYPGPSAPFFLHNKYCTTHHPHGFLPFAADKKESQLRFSFLNESCHKRLEAFHHIKSYQIISNPSFHCKWFDWIEANWPLVCHRVIELLVSIQDSTKSHWEIRKTETVSLLHFFQLVVLTWWLPWLGNAGKKHPPLSEGQILDETSWIDPWLSCSKVDRLILWSTKKLWGFKGLRSASADGKSWCRILPTS